ncbi:MAG: hypothetical protein JWO06_3140 [Bacteroidota bacterium]|nr:hypothetical protein [Bacteroidota bacterium]
MREIHLGLMGMKIAWPGIEQKRQFIGFCQRKMDSGQVLSEKNLKLPWLN